MKKKLATKTQRHEGLEDIIGSPCRGALCLRAFVANIQFYNIILMFFINMSM